MRLDYDSSPLVIIGGWNPNIFSVRWIEENLRHTVFLSDRDEDNPENNEIKFQMQMGQVYAPIYSPIEVFLDGLRMRTSGDRLEFILSDGIEFKLLEECANIICDCLPKTEVISYGANFTFVEDEINQYIADMIKSNEIITICDYFDNPLGIEDYNINIPLDNRSINIYTKVDHINTRTRVSFNFSFDINKLSHFKASISKHPICDLYECAKKIMLKTYKTELED